MYLARYSTLPVPATLPTLFLEGLRAAQGVTGVTMVDRDTYPLAAAAAAS